ncbi:MAG: oxygen-independent coproporphyrinogen III oxidase [Elusimicrobiota bacterium]
MEKTKNNMIGEIDMDIMNNLIKKYDVSSAFMYGEYPHKNFWSKKFNDTDFRIALKSVFSYRKDIPLLLYVHIPFCRRRCFYCTCRTFVTNDYERVKDYLNYLYREIDLYHEFFDKNSVMPNFREIHFGGGSPTILYRKEFDQLIEKLQPIVNIKNLDEFTIEIDPRVTTKEDLLYYHLKGINRISLGIQDFDPEVQKAVNRIQPLELTENLLIPDIRKKFKSVNFDIICGLPKQTRESFRKTIDSVIKLSPDRICLLYLIMSPEFSQHQKLMKESELPNAYERTMFFVESHQRLINNGYIDIGVDHFAKPTDDVAKGLKNKTLFWSGLGYTPGRYHDIIGIGTSSASRITDYYYAHNIYAIPDYETSITNSKFPIFRGYKLNDDDVLRRNIIHDLRTYFSLNCRDIEQKYSIEFKKYFKEEKTALEEFAKDSIIELSDDTITITETGKHFAPLVCKVFDKFIRIGKKYD